MSDDPEDRDVGPFDPDELVEWAENYGHPEGWAKRAQSAHARAERLHVEVAHLRKSIAHSDRDHWFAEVERLREERDRMERLLTAGNTAAVAAMQAYRLVAAGQIAHDDALESMTRLYEWSKDVRALASEQKP